MNTVPPNWRDCYLTVAQAASIVNMTTKALYNRINRGEGPELARIGRSIRIHGESIVIWIETPNDDVGAIDPLPSQNRRNGNHGAKNEC